ncbi:MAG TPA: c-type cytochrome domain-containing protein, partial [Planctomycetota bacterium]
MLSLLLLLAGQDAPVKALFEKHCLECHSAKKVKGGLRMDSIEALLAGGDTGPSIVPGHPEKSLLVTAIHGREPDVVTPMPYKK